MTIRFKDINPIEDIDRNLLVNGDTGIAAGFKVGLPELFDLDEDEASLMEENFTRSIQIMPDEFVFQKLDYHYVDNYKADFNFKENDIERHQKMHLDGRPITKHFSDIYLNFYETYPYPGVEGSSFYQIPNYLLRNQKKQLAKFESKVNGHIEAFKNELSSKNVKLERMMDRDLYHSFGNYINLNHGGKEAEDIVQPLEKVNGGFMSGHKEVRVYSIVKQPNILSLLETPTSTDSGLFSEKINYFGVEKLKTSLIYPLGLGLPFNHIVALTIRKIPKAQLLVKMKMEKFGLNMMATFSEIIGYEQHRKKSNAINDFLEAMEKKACIPCMVSLNVIIPGSDSNDLNLKGNALKTAAHYMNKAEVVQENREALNYFFANAPGNPRSGSRNFLTTLDYAVRYIQRETHYRDDLEGYQYCDLNGNPFLLNLDATERSEIKANHKFLVGSTGFGKSFWILDYIVKCIQKKKHVVFVDIGKSGQFLVKLLEGFFMDSSNPESFSSNPFLYAQKDIKDNFLPTKGDVEFIFQILKSILYGKEEIKRGVRTIFRKIIYSFYDFINDQGLFPDLNLFYDFLDVFAKDQWEESFDDYITLSDVKLNLSPYVNEGEYNYLLNSKENRDLTKERFVYFDLETANKDADLFPIISKIIMHIVNVKGADPNVPAVDLIWDEGLEVLEDPEMGNYIGYTFANGRKHGINVILSVQEASFLSLAHPKARDSIKKNTQTLILFDPSLSEKEYQYLKNDFEFTSAERNKLASIQQRHSVSPTDPLQNTFGDFFIRMKKRSRIVRLDASPYQETALDTKKERKSILLELEKKYGNTNLAILDAMEKKQAKQAS